MQSTHFTIVQGTPFEFLTRMKRRNEDNELVPMQLTNCVVRLQARAHVRAAETFLDLSSNGNGIVVDEEEGTFSVQMSSAETSALVWGTPHIKIRAVFQCEVEPPAGETIRVLQGSILLDPEVVR